jgi:hypothetical protein
MVNHYFQDVARSERYFTATLLAHLLMANNFEGTKLLFKYLQKDDSFDEGADFEIVTELDPLRDASVTNTIIQKLFKENGRVAVPDIFLRWGTFAFVIEAKFFTLPKWAKLKTQIKKQKEALRLILDKTMYDEIKLQHCLLLVKKPGGIEEKSIPVIIWDELIDLLEKNLSLPISLDCKYSFDILKRSIMRAKTELEKNIETPHIRISSIQALIEQLPQLLEDGMVYVGFSQGLNSPKCDLKYLETRSHYKVADEKYGKNWIRIEEIIGKYISLKY